MFVNIKNNFNFLIDSLSLKKKTSNNNKRIYLENIKNLSKKKGRNFFQKKERFIGV